MALDPDRRTVLAVALALAAVVALGVAAATLDSAVEPGGGSMPSGGAEPGGSDETAERTQTPDDSPAIVSGPDIGYCTPWLDRPSVVWSIAAVFLAVAGLSYLRSRSLLPPVTVFVAFGPPVYVLHTLLTLCPSVPEDSAPGAAPAVPNGSFFVGEGGGAGLGGSGVSPPTAALGILLFAALLGAVFLLAVSTGDDDDAPATEPSADDGETDDGDVAAVARVAGEAADRIEGDADADNEIFRAWAAMTEHLDVARPRSSTPAEFATAAVDAGMDESDVRELTGLFEAVRYGGATATAEREARAVAALRRIEESYGEEA